MLSESIARVMQNGTVIIIAFNEFSGVVTPAAHITIPAQLAEAAAEHYRKLKRVDLVMLSRFLFVLF